VGYEREPYLVPTIDGVIAATVGYVGFTNRSRLAAGVFFLFALLGVLHVVAFIEGTTESYYYYAAKNGIFLAQVLTVGGSGAWMALRNGLASRGERLGAHSLSRR
jgi:hypothetical protein